MSFSKKSSAHIHLFMLISQRYKTHKPISKKAIKQSCHWDIKNYLFFIANQTKHYEISFFILLLLIIPFINSCKDDDLLEDETTISQEEKTEKTENTEDAVESSYVTVKIRVKFSQELALQVQSSVKATTKSAKNNSNTTKTNVKSVDNALSSLSVTVLKRTFPYCGKFEKRTHEAGLDRWYDITFNKSKTLTKANNYLETVDGIYIVEYIPIIKISDRIEKTVSPSWKTKSSSNIITNEDNDIYQGTSMACPHVSGVATLIVSYFGGSGFTDDMLKERLLNSTNDIIYNYNDSEHKNLLGSGLIDARAAILYGTDPDPVTDYSTSAASNEITLTFTVPKDKDGIAPSKVKIYYSKNEIPSDLDFSNLSNDITAITINTDNNSAGDEIECSIPELDFSTTYYFALQSYDSSHNYSSLTNSFSETTEQNYPPVITCNSDSPYGLKLVDLYPNPVNSFVSVRPGIIMNNVTITFTNTSGAQVKKLIPSSTGPFSPVKVDFSYVAAGVYSVKVTSSDNNEFKSSIIKL